MEQVVVLVVEDDETTRGALVRLFARDPRVRAVGAEDGLAALRVLETQHVDIVISDEVMPRINGLRLLEAVNGRWPETRLVLYTGHMDTELVIAAINRGGVVKALSKGMPAEQFRAEVGEVIDDCLSARVGGVRPSSRRPVSRGGPPERVISVLAIADELAVRRDVEASLRSEGLRVRGIDFARMEGSVRDGADVIVVDLSGPDADGARTMHQIRRADLECPVVVLVPRNEVARAHEALRMGAHRYLVHPVPHATLLQVVNRAAVLGRLARARQEAADATRSAAGDLDDRAGLQARFERALDKLFMVYQPIVSWSGKCPIGFEALVRSEETSMPHPGLLLDAAARLDRMQELSTAIRRIAHQPFLDRNDDVKLFLNLHVSDVTSPDLLESVLGDVASRVVLEITERASLESVEGLEQHIAALRARGYRIAVDDLGAGYSGLSSFAMLDPDFVKLDMSLVRNLHESPVKMRLVQSLQEACGDLGVPMIAEGVESRAERDALVAAGCDLFQGYLFARPARGLPAATWS